MLQVHSQSIDGPIRRYSWAGVGSQLGDCLRHGHGASIFRQGTSHVNQHRRQWGCGSKHQAGNQETRALDPLTTGWPWQVPLSPWASVFPNVNPRATDYIIFFKSTPKNIFLLIFIEREKEASIYERATSIYCLPYMSRLRMEPATFWYMRWYSNQATQPRLQTTIFII